MMMMIGQYAQQTYESIENSRQIDVTTVQISPSTSEVADSSGDGGLLGLYMEGQVR